ncbi:MAG: Na+/H+ antiporter NhaA, partial [Planctomycetaceae bacterium]|nr:Na+/H+ antiporter NhaA [Planctomycetaceae bacterium]
MKKTVARLQEFSVPLIMGVVAALVAANVDPEAYHSFVHTPIPQWGASHSEHVSAAVSADEGWAHSLTLHFLVNDLFMVLFFGIAAKEITEACLPNGALNPVTKAINPLFATIGGVLGPIGVFLCLNSVMGMPTWQSGWGVPTATDIALAWLVARFLFGKQHPAVSFLLLLAVADDAIGLGIIAIGYPDPHHPTVWQNVLWILPGMTTAYLLRRFGVRAWLPYITIGGTLAWWGLHSAHLHPALALVFIVPFLPGPKADLGLYVDDPSMDVPDIYHHAVSHSCLERFEHDLKGVVDFGLFFFAFANAGVPFSEINGLTWIILTSLLMGKMLGITSCSWLACRLGFLLPDGMSMRQVFVTSLVAGLGLTVALFVSGEAFTDPVVQGAAKMGAVFSVAAAALAYAAKWATGFHPASHPVPATQHPGREFAV